MRSGASLTPRVLDHVLRAAENGTVEGEGDTALLGLTVHPVKEAASYAEQVHHCPVGDRAGPEL